MSNLLSSLRTSAMALDVLQRSVSASQNNVTNASTPGYARQRMALHAARFDPTAGLTGGVETGGLVSYRSMVAEASVRTQVASFGAAKQSSAQLAAVESALNFSDTSGIGAKLDALYSTFTAWTMAPGDTAAKENIYSAAGELAASFNRTADSLVRSADDAEVKIGETLRHIDTLAEKIRLANAQVRSGAREDAGLDAQTHAALEELATLVNVQALWQEDGSVTVLAGNEGALVVGERRYSLSVQFGSDDPTPTWPDALPIARIVDQFGNDLTQRITGGELGALVKFRNETIPQYLGTTQDQGSLNRLAQEFADRVNNILVAGYPAPQEPYHLFVYGASATSVAHLIRVNPALVPALLDATDQSGTPPVSNGKALQLADLVRSTDPADTIDGLTYTSYFSQMSADAGRMLVSAQEAANSSELLVVQARSLRAEISGVSLDEEAVALMEFERAYQATARMISVLDEMMQITLNLGRE